MLDPKVFSVEKSRAPEFSGHSRVMPTLGVQLGLTTSADRDDEHHPNRLRESYESYVYTCREKINADIR